MFITPFINNPGLEFRPILTKFIFKHALNMQFDGATSGASPDWLLTTTTERHQ